MKLMRILHVYRNTPVGRETLLGATWLGERTGVQLRIFVPSEPRFALNLGTDLVEIPLDSSYLTSPETARDHVEATLTNRRVAYRFVEPSHRVASTLPEIPADFDLMSCPRALAEPQGLLGPGMLGNRVRRLVRSATFPVLIPTVPLLEWDRVLAFFAGSSHALHALRWAMRIARSAGVPLEVITVDENGAAGRSRKALEEAGLLESVEPSLRILQAESWDEVLWSVPRTALVAAGAFGHSGIKATMFGSRTELLQSRLANPLLLVGPNASGPRN